MPVPIPAEIPEPLAGLLERRFSLDPDVARAARSAFRAESKGLELDADQGRALVRFATSPELPPPERPWEDAAADALQLLWTQDPDVREAVVPAAVEAYGGAREALRLALLTLLAATPSRGAAEAIAALVLRHGFPERPYPRLFTELHGQLDHADLLFPAIFERAGEAKIDVGNVLLAALAREKLAPAAVAALAPSVVSSLDEHLTAARRFERADGVAWRFAEDYHRDRSGAGFFADLAGFLPRDAVEPALRRALGSADPWLALFASTSLLRLGAPVDDAAIERVAACHETRSILFHRLEQLALLARFPLAHATLDAFAAADMVGWLKHPNELGREPDLLEKKATFEGPGEHGPAVLYVWRFPAHDGEPCAGASGPYEKEGVPGPVSGPATFSRFDPWDSATAEEHARAILGTLAEWRKTFEA